METVGYILGAISVIGAILTVLVMIGYSLGFDVIALVWWNRIRPFFYYTAEDYLAEERVYTIFPSGHESFGVHYHSILAGRKSKNYTLLGTFATEDAAKLAIDSNIRVTAIAKAESYVQLIREKKTAPYEWPDEKIRQQDATTAFVAHCNRLLDKEIIRG